MSGVCVDKLSHSCGSRQGLQVYANSETGKVDGYCWSCKTWVPNPYGEEKTIDQVDLPEPKSEAQIQEELAAIDGYYVQDLPHRKLRADSLAKFNIKVGVSEEDGKTPSETYFPITKGGKTTGYYVKTAFKPTKQWSIGGVKDGDLFGWERAIRSGASRLIITEGLEDAVAAEKMYEMYNNKPEYHPAFVSLPNGVNSVEKCLTKHASDIKRLFKDVILNFDNDEPGQAAVQKALMILPTARVVILPEKDANECIIKGVKEAAYKAYAFKAHVPKNTRIILGEDLHEAAKHPTPYGELTWPYPKMDKLLRGVRYGETVYIGSGVKMGKSELLNDIAGHFIRAHNVPVFMAKPEEENKKTYKLMCNKMVGKVFHDPDVDFDYEAYDKAGEMLKGKLMMVDLYQHLGWSSLKSDIVAAVSMGAKAVFIDPITNLTNGMSSGDANTKLQEIAQDLASMAHDLNVVIFIFVHLKAPEGMISKDLRAKKYDKGDYVGLGNCPHEFGGDIVSNQFAGSRAMMRSCNLMIGLEGNKDSELQEEVRNMRWLSILEDREFGNSAKVPLYWDKRTTLFKGV
ncbi:MAG: hypothetical protein GQ574_14745 [Crocinitomix sp.]|nr:hypothetical protein [Crocinitomix sp.]